MKKILLLFIITTLLSSAGCHKKTEDINERDISAAQTTAPESRTTATTAPKKTSGQTINGFAYIQYLDRDNLFRLVTSDYEEYIVDFDGNAVKAENAQLKSSYMESDSLGHLAAIADLEGENNPFVKDEQHEQIIGVCRMDEEDIIWVKTREETPTSSKIIFTAYNEQVQSIFQIDSDNPNIDKSNSEWYNNVNSFTAEYLGDNICKLGYLCINMDTQEIFRVNKDFIQAPALINEFNDGYAIVKNNIIDVHGNYLYPEDNDNTILKNNLCAYSCGLFFNKDTQKFYDINLNEKIDLSQYKLLNNMIYNFDETREKNSYVFQDGYCGIEIANEAGTRFYGIIDTNGNWVMELTDAVFDVSYVRKISDNILMLTGYIYNIQDKTIKENPKAKYISLFGEEDIIIDGVLYYLDNGEFCSYDYNTDTDRVIQVNL